MVLITTIIALIAILSTLYASDSLRAKAEKTKSGFLKDFFVFMDDALLDSEVNNEIEMGNSSNLAVEGKRYYSESFPMFKHIGMVSPVCLSEAKVLFIDMEGVKNSDYGRKLLLGTILLMFLIFILVAMVVFLTFKSIGDGEFANIVTYLLFSLLLGYVSLKSLKKVKKYSEAPDLILKSINSSTIVMIITEAYTFFEYGISKTTYSTSKIRKFIAEENKLFLEKENGKVDLLIHFPSIYARKMKHHIDFKSISSELNEFLGEMKSMPNKEIAVDA